MHLLDADVLIALTVTEHEHHERASRWAGTVDRPATCPVVEGVLLRFLIRSGGTPGAATTVLQAIRDIERCEFWPGSLSYLDADLGHVRGAGR